MKLIYDNEENGQYVEVEEANNDQDIFEMGEVIKKMLLAVGYEQSSINKIMKKLPEGTPLFKL